jgi:hypothetical protein
MSSPWTTKEAFITAAAGEAAVPSSLITSAE